MPGGTLDAVVVGAGWAGLGISHALKQRGLSHSVFERARIGETWRSQRWDSFYMKTPNCTTVLPGDCYVGSDPYGFMSCGEFVAMLDGYARRHALPVSEHTPVVEVTAEGDLYRVTTERGTFTSRSVVVASGSLNQAKRPEWARAIPPSVAQLDASSYRNAGTLPPGAVLVVGCGQSGGQIAEDAVLAGRNVYLATGRIGRLPRRYRGRDIIAWLLDTGLLDVPRRELVDAMGRVPPRALQGATHTLSLQSLSSLGVVLLGRLTRVEGAVLLFADDLAENMRFAEEGAARIKQVIDDYVSRTGIDAPAAIPDPAEIVQPVLADPPIRSLSIDEAAIGTIVWCTGFTGDFSWLRVAGALEGHGQPVQENGVAAVPGIYFAGIDFSTNRRSGTILSVDQEAELFAGLIAARC